MSRLLDRRAEPANARDDRHTLLSIGPKVTITGSIEFDGDIEVHGFVKGEVRCATINVARHGTVSGTIVASSAIISGGVSGTIFAEALVLKANSDVEGEICYRELALEQGSYFEGKSRPHDSPLDIADAPPDVTPRAQPIPQLRIA